MPCPLFDLNGRVALVTGGSRGLGKAMARGFAEAGANIVISSRNEEELRRRRPRFKTAPVCRWRISSPI